MKALRIERCLPRLRFYGATPPTRVPSFHLTTYSNHSAQSSMRKGLGGDHNPVPNSIETVNGVKMYMSFLSTIFPWLRPYRSPSPRVVKAISPERVQIPDGIPQSRRGGSLHRAFIALGSNVGDRIGMIEEACREMERRNIKVVRTSSLYETAAMYVTDQQSFINGACQVSAAMISSGGYSLP